MNNNAAAIMTMMLFFINELSLPLVKPPIQKKIMDMVKVRDKFGTVHDAYILLNGMRKMDHA